MLKRKQKNGLKKKNGENCKMKIGENYFNQKRLTGLLLVVVSILGMVYFKSQNYNDTIFYLSFGWGLGMLI